MRAEPIPEWIFDGDDANGTQSIQTYRSVAFWLFQNRCTVEDRVLIRAAAERQAEKLSALGLDPLDLDEADKLWEQWLIVCGNWQGFMIGDCQDDAEHIIFHAVRALQWSSLVLLLTTDPTTPGPIDLTDNQEPS